MAGVGGQRRHRSLRLGSGVAQGLARLSQVGIHGGEPGLLWGLRLLGERILCGARLCGWGL